MSNACQPPLPEMFTTALRDPTADAGGDQIVNGCKLVRQDEETPASNQVLIRYHPTQRHLENRTNRNHPKSRLNRLRSMAGDVCIVPFHLLN